MLDIKRKKKFGAVYGEKKKDRAASRASRYFKKIEKKKKKKKTNQVGRNTRVEAEQISRRESGC